MQRAPCVYWTMVLCCQDLSEQFIREHSNKIDWSLVNVGLELSASFIRVHSDILVCG
jgi:hypothetical protein